MQVGGVHSGIVHSITLPHKPGDKVVVVMDLDRSTKEILKRDSVASIETEGVLGNQYRSHFVWLCRTSRSRGRRDYPECSAAGVGRAACKDERHFR